MKLQSNNRPEIEFLFFSDCPNSTPTLDNLRIALEDLDIQVEPSLVDVDPESFDRPFPGSPTVLVNGVDLYTLTKPESFDFACRTFEIGGEKTGVLSVEFVRTRLERLLSADPRRTPDRRSARPGGYR